MNVSMIQEKHSYDYDLAVIGGGPAGCEVAKEVAKHGRRVVLFEADKLGGTCLNRGCIPAKTMLYAAEMYRHLDKMAEYGIQLDKNSAVFDYAALAEKRRMVMDKLRKGLRYQMDTHKVEIKEAYATIKDAHTIAYGENQIITADRIVMASGGKARKFKGFVDNDKRFMTSDNVFELYQMPKSIAIVGAGPVGTEFASFFHTFGCEVHIIEMQKTFLANFDHKLGDALVKSLQKDGIICHTGVTIQNFQLESEATVKLNLSDGSSIEVERVLSAIGVALDHYCFAEGCIAKDEHGKVVVDEHYRTSFDNIYAIGDLIGKSGSAYGAEREARHIAYHMLGLDMDTVPVDYSAMPDVIFTHPEVATCGLSAEELAAQNMTFDTRTVQYIVNAKANIKGEKQGQIWMYSEIGTGRILGVHIIGPQATELIHMVPVLLLNNLTINDYLKTVWGHPVMAELLKEVMTLG